MIVWWPARAVRGMGRCVESSIVCRGWSLRFQKVLRVVISLTGHHDPHQVRSRALPLGAWLALASPVKLEQIDSGPRCFPCQRKRGRWRKWDRCLKPQLACIPVLLLVMPLCDTCVLVCSCAYGRGWQSVSRLPTARGIIDLRLAGLDIGCGIGLIDQCVCRSFRVGRRRTSIHALR